MTLIFTVCAFIVGYALGGLAAGLILAIAIYLLCVDAAV